MKAAKILIGVLAMLMLVGTAIAADAPVAYTLTSGSHYEPGQTMLLQNYFQSQISTPITVKCDIFLDEDSNGKYDIGEPHDELSTSVFQYENISFTSKLNIPFDYAPGEYYAKGVCELGSDSGSIKSVHQFMIEGEVNETNENMVGPVTGEQTSDNQGFIKFILIGLVALFIYSEMNKDKAQYKHLIWRK